MSFDGPRKGLDWLAHSSGCRECREQAWEDHEVPNIWFGAVPGGASKGAGLKAKEKKFQKDMDSYASARKNGLKPDQVSAESVEKAEKVAYGAEPEYDAGVRL